jgi:phosphoglycolate phosphatase-like HAD superfamily hydrolase
VANFTKTIMLDFDGVLVESVGIKDRAFKELFSVYPEFLDEILTYHLSHNAVVRYDKFQYIFEKILKKEYTNEIKDDFCQRYSQYVVKNVIACPSVNGAEEFLSYFSPQMPLYIISVNPKEELKQIINARGWGKYFKDIYPFLWKKSDAMKDILSTEGLQANQVVYIGDSPEDYSSAREAGVPFIGCLSSKILNTEDSPICRDLFEVKDLIT